MYYGSLTRQILNYHDYQIIQIRQDVREEVSLCSGADVHMYEGNICGKDAKLLKTATLAMNTKCRLQCY